MQAMPTSCRICDGDLPFGGTYCGRCGHIARNAKVEQVMGGRWDGAWRASMSVVSAYGVTPEDAIRELVDGTVTVKDWNKKTGGSNG